VEVYVYSFEDRDGNEESFQTQDHDEAKRFAEKYKLKMLCNTFKWSERETVLDFTGGKKR